MNLTDLEEGEAGQLVLSLLDQLGEVRVDVEGLQRRAAGIRKMIDALVEMFPAHEDLLPEDLDEDDEPRPRGAEAARRVLADRAGTWYTVPKIVAFLEQEGWLPVSSNPANAVRSALARLVETKTIHKSTSTKGAVIYQHPASGDPTPPAVGPGYAYDEEPF